MFIKDKNKGNVVVFLLMLVLALFMCSACDIDFDYDDEDGSIVVEDGDNFCLEDITNYTPGRGPFRATRSVMGMVKAWVPQNIPRGCKVPIIHLANGTGGMCAGYAPILNNLAEYGFIAVCYESMNTGQGTQAITAVQSAMNRFSFADKGKLGFTGHSQGGGATFMGVYHAEKKWGRNKIYSGLAMEPASGFGNAPVLTWQSYYRQIKSPMSMFNGQMDTLVFPFYVRAAYNALPNSNFKVWYTAKGAGSTHIPVPNGPTQEMSIPWFRWTLLGDSNACQEFKNMPRRADWGLAAQANVPACR